MKFASEIRRAFRRFGYNRKRTCHGFSSSRSELSNLPPPPTTNPVGIKTNGTLRPLSLCRTIHFVGTIYQTISTPKLSLSATVCSVYTYVCSRHIVLVLFQTFPRMKWRNCTRLFFHFFPTIVFHLLYGRATDVPRM